jgi:hypothetical protein
MGTLSFAIWQIIDIIIGSIYFLLAIAMWIVGNHASRSLADVKERMIAATLGGGDKLQNIKRQFADYDKDHNGTISKDGHQYAYP